jgi:ABC-type sugar transport system permease subunit
VPLLVWRALATLASAAGAIAVLAGAGDLGSLVRWGLAIGLLAATAVGVIAFRGTLARKHVGRFAGFVLDGLGTVVFGFLALNEMHMFTGLDAAGEEFNGAAPWVVLILVGWLVTGFATRGAHTNEAMQRIGHYTMVLGLVVLLLFMNILPGLVEFARRLFWADVLPYAAIAVLSLVFTKLLWSHAAARYFQTSRTQAETMEGVFFVAPNVLGFLAFFAGPLVASLFFSFTEWDGLTDAEFVGFRNYIDLFSDDLFRKSITNILFFGLFAIPAAVIPALLLAGLLNTKIPGVRAFRAIYFLPSIAGVVGVTLIWKQLFNSTVGYINYAILRGTDAVNAVLGTSFDAAQPEWISDSSIAMIAVIILFAWQQMGFNIVLFLAGMQGISPTLYEAAELDGATGWKRFRYITIPLLAPTTVFVVATTTILGLQMFNEPFILQAPASPRGPNNSTLTPVVYLYQNAFQEFEIGYASAVAWALFILIFGITLLYFRRTGGSGGAAFGAAG